MQPWNGRHDGHEYWTLPGGGVEPGETLESAVRRESGRSAGDVGAGRYRARPLENTRGRGLA
ncbi:MAG: NUDIX domain-containing protein [Micromonosporaceae bacterium]|nr:NUDIX domain-containing protein [Micromonosporaceae bacterium]